MKITIQERKIRERTDNDIVGQNGDERNIGEQSDLTTETRGISVKALLEAYRRKCSLRP